MGSGKVYYPPESVISFLRVSWALTKGQNLGGHLHASQEDSGMWALSSPREKSCCSCARG